MNSILECAEVAALVESNPESVVLIDTRSPEAYARGHLPGAYNLREVFTFLATTDYDGLENLTASFVGLIRQLGIQSDQKIIFYEEQMNDGFGQSCRGWYLMQYLGHPDAAVLHGGYRRWIAEGFQTTIVPPSINSGGNFEARTNLSLMVTRDELLGLLDDDDTIILDVRDVDEWIGESSSPYGVDFCPRKGRIPGARWIEWYRFMKPGEFSPVFKNSGEVLAELQTVGIHPDSHVVVYCFKGARAANTLLCMKNAGIDDVRLYFGGWNEWSRDYMLPIDVGFPVLR